MSKLLQDLRFGLRMLAKNPGFTVVAVLTLALGIGANTAIFSVMNAALMRRLPVRDPDQLVRIHITSQPFHTFQTGHDDTSLTEPIFQQLRQQRRVFSDVVAYVPLALRKVAVRFGDEPEEANADMVSGNFFSGLGVRMARGRGFTLEDESQHTPTAVLSYAYWTRRFARSPSVLGQTLYIKGVPFTIIGVAQREFEGVEPGEPTDIWIPFQTRNDLKPWGRSPANEQGMYNSPNWLFLMMIGRLQAGRSEKPALAQLNPVIQRVFADTAGKPEKGEQLPTLSFTPVHGIENMQEDYEKPLYLLMAMVAIVLLIACSNVAMLLVARNTTRRNEFRLRIAMGARRFQLFRHLLTESLLLVAGGTALGWILAVWATQSLAAWAEMDFSVAPDHNVLAFTLGISALAALVFGLAPLRDAMRCDPGLARKTSARTAGRDKHQNRTARVVALQISVCLVLLVGAGLLFRTLRNLENLDLGLDPQGLLVFGISPPQTLRSDAEVRQFYQSLMDRLRALPGVESATLMGNRIGSGWSNNTGAFVDGAVPAGLQFASMRWNSVGPDYFHVLKIHILEGRDINDSDSASAPKVAIINHTFAQKYLQGREPIGHQVAMRTGPKADQFLVVGVVQDSKYTGVEEKARPMAYFPYAQLTGTAGMSIELRTEHNPAALLPEVRRTVREFGPDLPLLEPMTQREQFDQSISDERLSARLAISFGVLAALLVATGLYGTLSYRVSRRTAEIGVRLALGAQRSQVLGMVLRESLIVSVAGLIVGLPLAIAGARLLRSMLYGLGPGDPMAFAAAILGLLIVVFGASWIPARRATKVDPMVALRYE